MKDKLRLLIREEVSKVFENYYDDDSETYQSSFDYEDIPDMKPGGSAYQAAIRDIKSDTATDSYQEPSDEELEDIIAGLQNANLDLPSDKELINQAEESLHRHLRSTEISKIKRTKERMESLMGVGSFNESFSSEDTAQIEIPQEEIESFYNEYLASEGYIAPPEEKREAVKYAMEQMEVNTMEELWKEFNFNEKTAGDPQLDYLR